MFRYVAVLLGCVWLLVASAAGAGPVRSPGDAPVADTTELTMSSLPQDFETFDGGWIHLAYPAQLRHWAQPLVAEASTFRTLARERLGQPVLNQVRVRLAEDPSQMAALAPVGVPYPKYAAGVAYSALGLVLLTNEPVHAGNDHDLRETFRHELAHIALYDAISKHAVPLWFNEGLAVHLSGEKAFARMQTLWTAAVAGELTSLHDIEQRFPDDVVGVPLAYAQSADVVRYLLRQEDQTRFALLIKRVARGQPFDSALYDAYGFDTRSLEYSWREDVDRRFSIWPILFSGTVLWVFAVGLAGVAWRKKRKHHHLTLSRWAKEEAAEDERLAAVSAAPALLPWMIAQGASPSDSPAARRESLVPKVEHDGNWHTLH